MISIVTLLATFMFGSSEVSGLEKETFSWLLLAIFVAGVLKSSLRMLRKLRKPKREDGRYDDEDE